MARKDKTTLAHRIRERRLAIGLTQRDVAGNDFTRGFISQIENGLIDPSLKSLEIIAQRLGTSVSYFLANDSPVEAAELLSMLRRSAALRDAGDLDSAYELATQAVEMASRQSDVMLQARMQRLLGWLQYDKKQFEKAAQTMEIASQSFQKAGDMLDAAKALNTAGSAWHHAHNTDKAIASYRAALKMLDAAEESREDRLRISVNMALSYFAKGEYDQALPLLQQILERERQTSDYYRLGDIYVAIGLIYKNTARYSDAITAYNNARSIYAGVPDKLRHAHATLNCGTAYAAKKEWQQAKEHLQEALQAYEALQQPAFTANAHAELANVAWYQGSLDEAAFHCNAAVAGLAAGRERGRMLLLNGRICEKRNDLDAAYQAYVNGLEQLDAVQDPEAVEACFALGNLLLRLGRAEEASHHLARAAASFRKMNH